MRMLRWAGALAAVIIVVGGLWMYAATRGWLGRGEQAGQIVEQARPSAVLTRSSAVQRRAANLRGIPQPKQILFGDLHVHTTFSLDAFLMSLPLAGGTGSHPPADACDFARYCSQLDFWSINDHAEGLTPRLWRETIDSIRQCNAVAGDPSNPDVVAFLGWEWSQMGLTPESHYGHKNVVLRGLADGELPARPIGARGGIAGRFLSPRAAIVLSLTNGQRGRDLAALGAEILGTPLCADGVPVRELPPDCMETTVDPAGLFSKLHDWNVPAIVIPHGTSWGIYTPPGASWAKQIASSDRELETLVEIYSGHGSAEEYREWRAARIEPDGRTSCPEPSDGYLPSCWHAGELIRARCMDEGESQAECETRAGEARAQHLAAGLAGWRTVPGSQGPEWLDAGQCTDCFLPAFNHRPAGSAQYMLARRSFSADGRARGLRLGFIGSSDIHTSRAGTGYKEFARGEMSEGMGRRPDAGRFSLLRAGAEERRSRSTPLDPATSRYQGLQLFEFERGAAYLLTGGLVAAHSAGRSRHAVWQALQRKEVYATSGPRILLWFDLLDEGLVQPMGSSVRLARTPRFRVRAIGSFEQKPGCADFAAQALGAERLRDLCLGECYHPSDRRRLLTRIEVVRIRPQTRPDEPLAELIDDPWRRFPCPADPSGCTVEFEDPDFAAAGRDSIYYVRAIEAPSPAIHADPLRCRRDASGRCTAIELCNANTSYDDDCLDETEERAWSSPIFLEFAAGP